MHSIANIAVMFLSFPQDYYSIPFAAPTTALTGREGSLTSNPYSGESPPPQAPLYYALLNAAVTEV